MSGRLSCGRDYHFCPEISNTLEETCKAGFDFACVPITNPRFKREFLAGPAKNRPGAVTRSDMVISSQDWSSLIVAKISPWIQVDSAVESVRKNSERAFKQELTFASHLSVPAIMIPIKQASSPNLARIINDHIHGGHNHQFWCQVPTVAPQDEMDDVFEDGSGDASDTPKQNPWNWWNNIRCLCDHSKRLGLSLEMSADVPTEAEQERWCGEPVKSLVIPTSVFLTNKKGYPVLSRAHQNFVKRLFKLDVQLIVSGSCRHVEFGMRTYHQYLEHLFDNRNPPDPVEQFAKGYEDFLQCPLQPLMDNLESQTYEVFEKDPIKYSQYQKAIYYALLDRILPAEKETKVLVVMVLGAGRGPLVTAALTAANKADRKIKVYAVEKNPNAVITLENLKYEMWGEQVTVVSSDMRQWQAPEKADIIVSELLGSFGDNELSPECLDGAQHFLKEDGISIPKEYTSFLAPLSSPKLWNETRACKEVGKIPETPFETPYVVRLHNVNILDVPKPLFTFVHPNREGEQPDNTRFESLDFEIAEEVVLHGFAGYFDCVLYGNTTISIVPQTHSPGMFSWFPIYFPIKDPMLLRKGEQLKVNFWRLVSPQKVWYEWCVSAPEPRQIHNPKGRSYWIGL